MLNSGVKSEKRRRQVLVEGTTRFWCAPKSKFVDSGLPPQS
jgi:hypothetical protein